MRIRNIIFDWSGTLSDDLLPVHEATTKLFDKYGAKRLSLSEFRKKVFWPYSDFLRQMIRKGDGSKLLEEFFDLYTDIMDKAVPFPGTHKLLKYLHKKNIKMAVVSAASNEIIGDDIKRYFGGKNYFFAICGRAIDKAKAIKALLRKFGLVPEETIYVCDSKSDIVYAHEAGIRAAAVMTGYQPHEDVLSTGPDFVLEKAFDVLRIV